MEGFLVQNLGRWFLYWVNSCKRSHHLHSLRSVFRICQNQALGKLWRALPFQICQVFSLTFYFWSIWLTWFTICGQKFWALKHQNRLSETGGRLLQDGCNILSCASLCLKALWRFCCLGFADTSWVTSINSILQSRPLSLWSLSGRGFLSFLSIVQPWHGLHNASGSSASAGYWTGTSRTIIWVVLLSSFCQKLSTPSR